MTGIGDVRSPRRNRDEPGDVPLQIGVAGLEHVIAERDPLSPLLRQQTNRRTFPATQPSAWGVKAGARLEPQGEPRAAGDALAAGEAVGVNHRGSNPSVGPHIDAGRAVE